MYVSAGIRKWPWSIGPTRSIAKFATPKLEVGDTWVSRLNDTDGKIEVEKIAGNRMVVNWFGHQNTYTLEGNLISGHVGTLDRLVRSRPRHVQFSAVGGQEMVEGLAVEDRGRAEFGATPTARRSIGSR